MKGLIVAKKYADPLLFLSGLVEDENADIKARLDAAKAMLPYVHPKLGEQGKKDAQQEQAEALAQSAIYTASKAPKKLRAV